MLSPRSELTLARRQRFARVAAHELGHQWFGNLVTMQWWDDLWHNEAFATWIEDVIVEQLCPSKGKGRDGVGGTRSGALYSDGLGTGRRIRQPIVAEEDIEAAF